MAVNWFHSEAVQFPVCERAANTTDVNNRGNDALGTLKERLRSSDQNEIPSSAELADLYSVLRCYGGQYNPTTFLEILWCRITATAETVKTGGCLP